MTRLDFWTKLLGKMLLPVTDWRIAVFEFWANQEGMPYDKTFNPLATTYLDNSIARRSTIDIGFGPGKWNTAAGNGVGIYATENDGVQATFETLKLSYYDNIRKMFLEQKPNLDIVGPHDFTSWVGSNEYGKRIYDYALSLPAPSVTISSLTAEQRAEVMKMVEFFVSSSFPAYWEALWNKGFTKYQNPLKPWETDSKAHADELASDLRDAITKYLEG